MVGGWRWVWRIGGMILTGENRSIRRKTYPSATLSTTDPIWTCLESNSVSIGKWHRTGTCGVTYCLALTGKERSVGVLTRSSRFSNESISWSKIGLLYVNVMVTGVPEFWCLDVRLPGRTFLGAFAKLRKGTVSFITCLSVWTSAWYNWAATGRISWNLRIFRNSVEKFPSSMETWQD